MVEDFLIGLVLLYISFFQNLEAQLHMASPLASCLALFLLHLLINSGSSIAGKPSPEAIREQNELDGHRNRILISPLFTEDELDTAPGNIPVVNPTTPVVNPTTPTVQPINPPAETTTPTPVTSGGQWCIASPTASPTALQVALDYACGYGGADCSALQPGASCFDPNNLRDHASYAFNDYYQKNPAPTSCVFGGTAQLTNTDPSNGNCHYASSSKSTRYSLNTNLHISLVGTQSMGQQNQQAFPAQPPPSHAALCFFSLYLVSWDHFLLQIVSKHMQNKFIYPLYHEMAITHQQHD